MNVQDLFEMLSFGELSNLSISNEGSGEILVDKQPSIVYYTRQALTLLYSRFAHKIDYVILEQIDGITRYNLDKQFSVSDETVGNVNPRYLLDSVIEPFDGNVLKLLSVRPFEEDGELAERDLMVNDTDRDDAIKMLTYKSFMMKTPTAGQKLRIEFQQNHAPLSIPVALTEEIFLAPVLEEALAYKVAARVFSSMNGELHAMRATYLENQYERVCQTVTAEDLLSLSTTGSLRKFRQSGFV